MSPLPTPMAALYRSPRLWVAVGLAAAIVSGLWVRLAPYSAWTRHRDRCFVQGEPLPTTFDAPYYMRLARDVVEGTYEARDPLRGVPDSPARPRPVPLLSLLTAGLHKLSGVSIPWLSLALPAALGALSALCLYVPARALMGPLGAVIACAALALSPFFVHRTNLGRLDTDSLNVGLPVLVVGCLMGFANAPRRAGLWLGSAVAAVGLHAWWWDQSPQTPFLLATVPLATALVKRRRMGDRKSLWVVSALVFCAAAAVLALKGPAPFVDAWHRARGQLTYMLVKQAPGDFPNIGLSISEQVRPSLEEFGRTVAGHAAVLVVAVVGLGWLFIAQPSAFFFFAPLVVLGFAGSFFAQRLAVFAAPLVGLGLGWVADRMHRRLETPGPSFWERFRREGARRPRLPRHGGDRSASSATAPPPAGGSARRWFSAAAAFMVGTLFLLPAFFRTAKAVRWPSENAPVVAGMIEAARRTPENAVLWAWWDHGYHLQYWARRGTIADGEIHGGELVVSLAVPLAATDENFAANFMIFFASRGLSGIREFSQANGLSAAHTMKALKAMLSAGPDGCEEKARQLGLTRVPGEKSWSAFFYPDPPRPVYLFLDQLLLNTAYWWYWFGTWDPEIRDGIHPAYRPVYPVVLWDDPTRRVPGAAGVHLQRGELHLGDRLVPLTSLGVVGPDGTRTVWRYRDGLGPHLDVHQAASLGVLMDGAPIGHSVFHRLFFLNDTSAQGRFRRIAQKPFVYQLWEVLPIRR
uniref:Oligosaccharyl transferase n=1 Tax=Desulfacinum infernum TaxID=35837 RepID=A0A832A3C1_9BACT